jgi:hypothetical protein
MSSISSINPGLENLLQTLSKVDSPVLSNSNVVTALEQASPDDVVQLNAAANQLETVDALFGVSVGSSESPTSDLSSILADLEPSTNGTESSSTSPDSTAGTQSSSPASATALSTSQVMQAEMQAAEAAELFDPQSDNGSTGSLLDIIG